MAYSMKEDCFKNWQSCVGFQKYFHLWEDMPQPCVKNIKPLGNFAKQLYYWLFPKQSKQMLQNTVGGDTEKSTRTKPNQFFQESSMNGKKFWKQTEFGLCWHLLPPASEGWGKYWFHRCLSVHKGEYPRPRFFPRLLVPGPFPGEGTPVPDGDTPVPGSFPGSWSQVLFQGRVPQFQLGVPQFQPGIGYSLGQDWGTPNQDWGTPPWPRQD